MRWPSWTERRRTRRPLTPSARPCKPASPASSRPSRCGTQQRFHPHSHMYSRRECVSVPALHEQEHVERIGYMCIGAMSWLFVSRLMTAAPYAICRSCLNSLRSFYRKLMLVVIWTSAVFEVACAMTLVFARRNRTTNPPRGSCRRHGSSSRPCRQRSP
jgi:hypothetical protein